MGLDVLFNGGRSVRLFIQGCLILWLGLFSSFLSADELYKQTYDHCGAPDGRVGSWANPIVNECNNRNPGKECYYTVEPAGNSNCGPPGYDNYQAWNYYVWIGEPCEIKSHEPDADGSSPSECSCQTPWVPGGAEAPYECMLPKEPEECYENGQIYDAQYGYCVLDCPNGQLNGICLQDTADNADTCNSDSPDYKGSIGFGSEKQNICLSDTTCEGGSLGVVNNVQMCVPDEYGPPTCPADGVLVMDEYGWVCESLNDTPEPEPEPDPDPNTDTDGDGEPDEYQRENDPDAVNKGLDQVSDGISDTNKELGKANKQLDNIGKGLSEINKSLDTGLGELNNSVDEITDGLQPPEGGFNPDGFGGMIPTFEETTTAFSNSLASIPAVTAVASIANLPESLTCPVYTIPATPVSGPLVMDMHCAVFNDYSGVISALFLFFWSGTALFLFLRA